MGDETGNPGAGEVGTSASGGTLLKVGTTFDEGNVNKDGTDQKPTGPTDCPNKNFPGLPDIPLKADIPKYDNSKPDPPKQGGVDTTGTTPPPPGDQPPLKGGADTPGTPNGGGETPGPVNLIPGTGTPDDTPGKPPLKGQENKNDVPLQSQTPTPDTTKPKPKKKLKIKIDKDPCKKIKSVTNNNDNFVPLTGAILQKFIERATGNPKRKSKLDLSVLADALNDTMRRAEINNRRRETAFLAEVIMETAYFDSLHEYGRGKGHAYGNYYGRGFVHLTWKASYQAAGKALNKNDPDRLVNNPDLVETDPEANAAATAWYWLNHHAKGAPSFNELADDGDFAGVTYHLFGATIHSRNAGQRRSVKQRDCYHLLIQQLLNEVSAGQ